MTDIVSLTAELVNVASVSCNEAEIASLVESRLRACKHLELTRIGDNVIARTTGEREGRVILAGHLDTVPPADNETARIDGEVLWGLGSADMKGGLAVMLILAEEVTDPALEVTFIFYAREEIAASESGLIEVAAERPELLEGDLVILGEGTDGEIEAGCQGTMRARVTLKGIRSHSARPWMGRNAIHRLGGVIGAIDGLNDRRPVIEGCEFREATQVVAVDGGVAGNVVPDEATITINHRFGPDRSVEQAVEFLRNLVEPFLEDGDEFVVIDAVGGATPATGHPLLQAVIARHSIEVTAKLGWTDVARFAEFGVPGVNMGAGDPRLAHMADERVERAKLERCLAVLRDLISR